MNRFLTVREKLLILFVYKVVYNYVQRFLIGSIGIAYNCNKDQFVNNLDNYLKKKSKSHSYSTSAFFMEKNWILGVRLIKSLL